jgi:predicted acyltransferase
MTTQLRRERFLSLDVFRGMTICFMIIVNAPGSGADPYPPLDHAPWFGFTPTDLVFPSFLFAVGNALSFTRDSYQSNAAFLQKVLKRTLIIFLLGYLMYWFPFVHRQIDGSWAFKPLSQTRIMGVLQRIALCYAAGALIVRYFSPRSTILISLGLLLGYWALLYLLGQPGQELTMVHNAGTLLDIRLLGDAHLYHDKGGPVAFDPEGLLSTLPAIVNVIAGYRAGVFIREKGKEDATVARLLMAGVLLVFAALLWAPFFPLAKKLWTSSFVLLTVGIDLVLLGMLIFAVEIQGWRRGLHFFLVFGKNPLVIYLLSELLLTTLQTVWVKPGLDFYDWINKIFFQVVAPGALGTLLFAIAYMLLCWLVGAWMDKRKLYIKI